MVWHLIVHVLLKSPCWSEGTSSEAMNSFWFSVHCEWF